MSLKQHLPSQGAMGPENVGAACHGCRRFGVAAHRAELFGLHESHENSETLKALHGLKALLKPDCCLSIKAAQYRAFLKALLRFAREN